MNTAVDFQLNREWRRVNSVRAEQRPAPPLVHWDSALIRRRTTVAWPSIRSRMVVVTNHRLQQIPSEWTLADIGVGAPSVAGNHLENFLYHPYKCSGIFF